jgi:hypothetical protein
MRLVSLALLLEAARPRIRSGQQLLPWCHTNAHRTLLAQPVTRPGPDVTFCSLIELPRVNCVGCYGQYTWVMSILRRCASKVLARGDAKALEKAMPRPLFGGLWGPKMVLPHCIGTHLHALRYLQIMVIEVLLVLRLNADSGDCREHYAVEMPQSELGLGPFTACLTIYSCPSDSFY